VPGIAGEPQVERWPINPDRFVVTYTLTGSWTPPFVASIKALENTVVESVSFSAREIQLYGVRQGQEAAVHGLVVEAIKDENDRVAQAEAEAERARPEREAEEAARETELVEVRDAFRRAYEQSQ
jgi:hypothetical protein